MQLRVLGCQGGFAPARHLSGLLVDGTVLLESDNLKAVNDGDELQVIGSVGVAFT